MIHYSNYIELVSQNMAFFLVTFSLKNFNTLDQYLF